MPIFPARQVKEFSRHGIPDEIRGEVWMYLLGVLSPDKSESYPGRTTTQQIKLTIRSPSSLTVGGARQRPS